ncbi:MAG: nicotinamide riboside transporter PnuC, partial [Allosphingosinicella sp.]
AAAAVAAIAGWGALMHAFTDASYPLWDASVAILSIFAQILLARRYLENWLVWILVDLISIGLYAAKGLWLTTLLYVIFLALATLGFVQWRRTLLRGGPATA